MNGGGQYWWQNTPDGVGLLLENGLCPTAGGGPFLNNGRALVKEIITRRALEEISYIYHKRYSNFELLQKRGNKVC